MSLLLNKKCVIGCGYVGMSVVCPSELRNEMFMNEIRMQII